MELDLLTVAASVVAGAALAVPVTLALVRKRFVKQLGVPFVPAKPGPAPVFTSAQRGDTNRQFKVVLYENPRAIGEIKCAEDNGAYVKHFYEHYKLTGLQYLEFYGSAENRDDFRGRRTA